MLCPEAHVEKKRFFWRGGLLMADEAHRLLDDVFRQVIVRAIRRFDAMVVHRQVGVELIGRTRHEAIEPVKATLQRPLVERPRRRGLKNWGQMPFSGGKGVVAVAAQHLGERACALGNAPPHAGKAEVPVRQPAHAH